MTPAPLIAPRTAPAPIVDAALRDLDELTWRPAPQPDRPLCIFDLSDRIRRANAGLIEFAAPEDMTDD